ncbi:hypothetical protein QZH41_013091, partial [Actinostola sp. cb2023]
GIRHPLKKYGNNEVIYLPCKDILSIQRWSFDIPREKKLLRTDAGANRVYALQCKADIKAGRIKPMPEDIPQLHEYLNPAFPSDKQFIEKCQTLVGYGSIHFPDCVVQSDVSVKELTLKEGTDLLLVASPRELMFKTEKVSFFAPWCKIRRWSQVQGNSVHFEVFFTDEMRFEWIEVETAQAAFLMAAIAEFVFIIKQQSEEPTFKIPKWLRKKSENRLTWKLIKNELFSSKKAEEDGGEEEEEEEEDDDDDDEEVVQRLDSLYDEASSDESDGEQVAGASASRNKTRYRPSCR